MNKIKITLPDNTVREYDKGVKVEKVAKDISEGLARVALGAVVNGQIKGMQESIDEDADIRIVNLKIKKEKKYFGIHQLI